MNVKKGQKLNCKMFSLSTDNHIQSYFTRLGVIVRVAPKILSLLQFNAHSSIYCTAGNFRRFKFSKLKLFGFIFLKVCRVSPVIFLLNVSLRI